MRRRDFLALTPPLLLVPSFAPAAAPPVPLKRYKVAVIGTGWYGKMDLFRLLQVTNAEVVALCDVDRRQLETANERLRARHPDQTPRLYADHTAMLRQEKPDLALIETPDHWHALQAIDCLRDGCHVYLQKPVGVDVRECEAVVAAAKKYKRTVQVALQRRSTPHLKDAKLRFVDSGRLGRVHHVDMWCYYHMRDEAVRAVKPVPDHFDYERWTGPAPLLPFRGVPHRRWRAFTAYGNGIVGDMCVHYFDAVRWLLGLGWPEKVSSQGGIFVDTAADATTTDTQTAVFEYPREKLNIHWTHRAWGTRPDADWPWAFVLYGEHGTLKMDTHKYEFLPAKKGAEPIRGEARTNLRRFPEDETEEGIELHVASAVRAHFKDWLAAIEDGKKPVADISEGYISTASCVLANLSCELGRPLSYNPHWRVVEGDEAATALLARPYRRGWARPPVR